MHNRMRVVAASFMVKNLLLPWQVRTARAAEGHMWFPMPVGSALALLVPPVSFGPLYERPRAPRAAACAARRMPPNLLPARRPRPPPIRPPTHPSTHPPPQPPPSPPTHPSPPSGLQWGLKHYWDALLDADLECDALGWQYVSGCMAGGYARRAAVLCPPMP